MARPRKHDRPALIRKVCLAVSGGMLVNQACAEHGFTASQLREWVAGDDKLSALYARAREEQAHALAEQALAIAAGEDAVTVARELALEQHEDKLAADDKRGWKLLAELRSGVVQRDRIRVDTIKWLTSKIAPRNYGERITQEVTGEGGGPVQVQQVWKFGDKAVTF